MDPILRSCIAAALLAAAVMADEVALMRVLSFGQWYHFGFLVISCAMLASAAAGIWRALRPQHAHTWHHVLAASVLFPLQAAALHTLPLESTRLLSSAVQLPLFLLVVTALAAPLFFVGAVMTDLLSNPRLPTRLLYAADLVGAAGGGALGLILLHPLGGMGTLVAAGAVCALGAVLLASNRSQVLVALLVVGLGIPLVVVSRHARPYITATKTVGPMAASQALANPSLILAYGEDGVGRVDILKTQEGPRILFDAGTAMTRVPLLTTNTYPALDDDLSAAFAPAQGGRALIIGSGGGWEVARALGQGVAHIVAVEVSGVVVDYVQTQAPPNVQAMFKDPRVELVHDEARSFLERSNEQFDLITLVHTISNTAAASGTLALAEDPLFTVEAVQTLARRLSPKGRLFITRPSAHIPALLSLMQAALPAPLQGHVLVVDAGRQDRFFASVTWSQEPQPSWPALPTIPNFAVPNDNRPYFNASQTLHTLSLSSILDVMSGGVASDVDRARAARLAVEELPAAVSITLLVSLGAALALTLLALWARKGASTHSMRLWLAGSTTGVAFMLVELAAVSRLTLLLGTPSAAFAAVAGALLAGAGLGSMLAHRFHTRLEHPSVALGLAAAGALLLVPLLPLSLGLLLPLDPGVRALGAVLTVFPTGVLLGLPFSLLVQRAQSLGGTSGVATLWAFNAVAGVLGGAACVLVGVTMGLAACLVFGGILYAGAALLVRDVA